jgi:hypothetical protein
MFDLIEDRKRPEIKWWTVPGAAVILFGAGVDVGILIGRRDADPSDWVQVAFLVLMSVLILLPIVRELSDRHSHRTRPDGH